MRAAHRLPRTERRRNWRGARSRRAHAPWCRFCCRPMRNASHARHCWHAHAGSHRRVRPIRVVNRQTRSPIAPPRYTRPRSRASEGPGSTDDADDDPEPPVFGGGLTRMRQLSDNLSDAKGREAGSPYAGRSEGRLDSGLQRRTAHPGELGCSDSCGLAVGSWLSPGGAA